MSVHTNPAGSEKLPPVKFDVEVTDTFGGESNYSWVRRYTIEVPASIDRQSAVVRAAKRAAGWSGLRCQTDSYGDSYTVRPVGRSAPCWIMFVNWHDDSLDDPSAEVDEESEGCDAASESASASI